MAIRNLDPQTFKDGVYDYQNIKIRPMGWTERNAQDTADVQRLEHTLVLRQEPENGGDAMEPRMVARAADATINGRTFRGIPASVFANAGITRVQGNRFLDELVLALRAQGVNDPVGTR